jgi:hypothetical protein
MGAGRFLILSQYLSRQGCLRFTVPPGRVLLHHAINLRSHATWRPSPPVPRSASQCPLASCRFSRPGSCQTSRALSSANARLISFANIFLAFSKVIGFSGGSNAPRRCR